MSYLLDKKTKQKKLAYILLCFVILIVIFFFRSGIFSGLSYASHIVFRPVLYVGNSIGGKFSGWGYLLSSKRSLQEENENLKLDIALKNATLSNYNSILDENTKIKEILGRKSESMNMVLAGILSKPNISLYDTLIIDAGVKQGVSSGDKVFALGNVPIGHIAESDSSTSKVILFSNPGEKTQALITGKDAFVEVVGRGGGNFEIILPRDFSPEKGTEVVLPGATARVLGIVQSIISDPRDSFVKALVVSPVNIQALKFVQVEI